MILERLALRAHAHKIQQRHQSKFRLPRGHQPKRVGGRGRCIDPHAEAFVAKIPGRIRLIESGVNGVWKIIEDHAKSRSRFGRRARLSLAACQCQGRRRHNEEKFDRARHTLCLAFRRNTSSKQIGRSIVAVTLQPGNQKLQQFRQSERSDISPAPRIWFPPMAETGRLSRLARRPFTCWPLPWSGQTFDAVARWQQVIRSPQGELSPPTRRDAATPLALRCAASRMKLLCVSPGATQAITSL